MIPKLIIKIKKDRFFNSKRTEDDNCSSFGAEAEREGGVGGSPRKNTPTTIPTTEKRHVTMKSTDGNDGLHKNEGWNIRLFMNHKGGQ